MQYHGFFYARQCLKRTTVTKGLFYSSVFPSCLLILVLSSSQTAFYSIVFLYSPLDSLSAESPLQSFLINLFSGLPIVLQTFLIIASSLNSFGILETLTHVGVSHDEGPGGISEAITLVFTTALLNPKLLLLVNYCWDN
jgi:hypothetical protein